MLVVRDLLLTGTLDVGQDVDGILHSGRMGEGFAQIALLRH